MILNLSQGGEKESGKFRILRYNYPIVRKHIFNKIYSFLPCVLVQLIVLTGFSGCTTPRHVRIIDSYEDPAGYLRIAAILSSLLPEMDMVYKGKYGFFIADDEELNAFAFADYTIVVNRSLLPVFDDRELACILAHEIAHISFRHSALRAAISNSRRLESAELDRVGADAGLLSYIIKPLAVKAYTRAQEIEADIEAVRAVSLLGISPAEYVAVLRKLHEKNSHTGGGLLDDHPAMESRIEKIEKNGLKGQ